MRAGLFGGTFNPIHLGHIEVARAVRRRFALDAIYLVPSALPPHKAPGRVADPQARLEMTRLAAAQQPGLLVSDVELHRDGPSYTIDTVAHFRRALPAASALFFIVGLDAFLEIDTWKDYLLLFERVGFIVVSRTLASHRLSPGQIPGRVARFLQERIVAGYRWDLSRRCFRHAERQPVCLMTDFSVEISATDIRQRLARGASIRPLVPPVVADYIESRGLYR